jgi:acylphosphatase
MDADVSIRQLYVSFSGRVQGVGFRWTVSRVAEQFEVSGYVRNCMDGSVELVAEGNEQDLVDLLNDVRSSSVGRYIAREKISWKPATGCYNGFGISF